MSIDCCTTGGLAVSSSAPQQRQPDAGSATLSADVGS